MTDNHLLLYRLAELMLEHEQHVLPVDLLFDDEQIGDFVKSIQIDSPYQQMLLEGVLTESVHDEKLTVSFTLEGYFHYVLGEVIYIRTEGLGAEPLKQIVEENKLNGSKEGVEQCLIRDVQLNDISRIKFFIDIGESVSNISINPLAFAFSKIKGYPKTEEEKKVYQKEQVDFVFSQLFFNSTDNDLIVLEKAIYYLERVQKHQIVSEIFLKILESFELNSIKKIILFIRAIQNQPTESKRDFESRLKDLKNPEHSVDAVLFYKLLGDFYNSLFEYNLACKYYNLSISTHFIITPKINSELIRTKIALGYTSTEIGNVKQAIENYEDALNLCIGNLNDTYLISDCYNATAVGFLDIDKFDAAVINFNKSIDIVQRSLGNYHPEFASLQYNLGCCYKTAEEYEKAISCFETSLKIIRGIYNSPQNLASHNYFALGQVSYATNDIKKSIYYYEEALKIDMHLSSEEYDPEIRSLRIDIGNLYFESNLLGRALDYYKESYKFIKDIEVAYLISKCYISMNKELEALNSFIDCEQWLGNHLDIKEYVQFAQRLSQKLKRQNVLPKWIEKINYDL